MPIVARRSSITDAKNLYIEREVAHFDASADGTIEMQTVTMDIADYLKQAGKTAGHRELWLLLGTLFKEDSALDEGVRSRTRRLAIYSRIFIGADRNFIYSNVVSAGGNGGDIVNARTLGVKDIP
jgi:hypothetical protein